MSAPLRTGCNVCLQLRQTIDDKSAALAAVGMLLAMLVDSVQRHRVACAVDEVKTAHAAIRRQLEMQHLEANRHSSVGGYLRCVGPVIWLTAAWVRLHVAPVLIKVGLALMLLQIRGVHHLPLVRALVRASRMLIQL